MQVINEQNDLKWDFYMKYTLKDCIRECVMSGACAKLIISLMNVMNEIKL